MVQTEVGIGKSMIRTEELHSADVSGVIGLSGDVAGAVVLSFPARVASKLASRFAGVELDVGQEDFSDAIGELTNMVAGNAKKDFGGLNVTISLPSVIVGAGHQVSQSSNSPQLVIPCQTLLGPFNVEVAMVVHKKSEATPAPAPPRAGWSSNMKILLVDDSRTIRSIQKNTLATMGHTDVLEAADGVEALSVLGAQRPDLVLVDWNMPKMDGITLVRRIREHDKTLPLIMVTTEAEKARVMEALKAGVSNYVVKPFTAETLSEKIDQTMSKAAAAAGTS